LLCHHGNAMWRMKLATKTNTDDSRMGSQRAWTTVMTISFRFGVRLGRGPLWNTFPRPSTGSVLGGSRPSAGGRFRLGNTRLVLLVRGLLNVAQWKPTPKP